MAAEANAAVLRRCAGSERLRGFSIEIVLSVLAAYFGAQPRASTVDEASLLAMLRASQRRQHLDDDPRRRSVPRRSCELLARSRGDARGEVPTAAVRLELARRQRIVAAEAHIAPLRARLSEALGDEAAAEVAGLVAIGVALREEAMSAPLLPPPPRQLWWASSTRKMNGGRRLADVPDPPGALGIAAVTELDEYGTTDSTDADEIRALEFTTYVHVLRFYLPATRISG